MNSYSKHKLVLFGAGKIGRSFIGQLFSRGNYEVVFIDIDKNIINEISRRGSYNVLIKGDPEEIINVRNIRGVWTGDQELVTQEIADASILAISVGLKGLEMAIQFIARGLLRRYEDNNEEPLDIIIAENLRNASSTLEKELKKILPNGYPLSRQVGLVETSIGKMVPLMKIEDMGDDILNVYAEPYNVLILDKIAFKNKLPEIEGLAPKDNIKAWVDRKLFIHNLGHACAAYFGAYRYPALKYMYEILSHAEVVNFTREAMSQSAKILQALYPGEFTSPELLDHINDLIARFQNRSLEDTVFRVGSDLLRKLGPNDRLVVPLNAGIRLNLPVDRIAEALYFGTYFRATDENGQMYEGDEQIIKLIQQDGERAFLENSCGVSLPGVEIILKIFEEHNSSPYTPDDIVK